MRRFIALALLVGAVLALPATMSGASGDVPRGLVCADVVDGIWVYTNNTVTLVANLEASPCTFGGGRVSYTLDVYPDAAMAPLLASTSSFTQEDPSSVEIRFGISNVFQPVGDDVVCIVLTTRIGGHQIDRAPDTGCVEASTVPPGFPFN